MATNIPIRKLREYMQTLRREHVAPKSKQTLFDIFQDHITILRDNLDEHYEQNPSIFAFWITKYEYEKFRLKRLERRFERLYSTKYRREKMHTPARTSETELKLRVNGDSELNTLQDTLDAQQYRVDVLKDVVDVMKYRHETIINLGATVRKEMSSQQDTGGNNNYQRPQRRAVFSRKERE